MVAVSSSLSISLASTTLPNKLNLAQTPTCSTRPAATSFPHNNNNIITSCSRHIINYDDDDEEHRNAKRRPLVLGGGVLALSLLFPPTSVFAQEKPPQNYEAFLDKSDGYTYYYPSDWREFDFRGHDSAFKDRYLQLQNVRVSFIPTDKTDIHDLGPRDDVISKLASRVYAAPTQRATIYDIQERSIDGKNYYTFEFTLTSKNFARSAFATIAIANGRYYTLIVGANDRRWKRVRNQLKVVADSFKVLDI